MTPDHYNKSDFDAFDKPDLSFRMIDALIVIVGLFAFILILGYMQQKDLEDEVEAHKASSQRYAGMLAECLNGGSLLDKTSGKGFFCGKAIEIQL